MDVETQASSVDVQVKGAHDAKVDDISLPPSEEERGMPLEENSDSKKSMLHYEDNTPFSATEKVEARQEAEEEEISFDGEFIKVEREPIDIKEHVHIHHGKEASDSIEDRKLSHHHFLEMQEKIMALEQDLENMRTEIKASEFEKSELQIEFARIKEISEEKTHHSVDLELKQKHLNEQLESAELQIKQYEQMYNSQFEALQVALKSQDSFQNDLFDAREKTSILSSELECSRQKTQELEEEVTALMGEAKKASEFQNLLELANVNAKEMEQQISFLQEEVSTLCGRVADNQKEEDTLKNTLAELFAVQEELRLSKTHTLNLEQKIVSSERVIEEVEGQLNLTRASEERLKHDFLALENLLAASKEDLLAKVTELEESVLKLMEERKRIIMLEDDLRNQEARYSILQEELDTMTKLKADTDATVSALDSKLSQMQELVVDFENRLKQSIDKCAESDSHLEKTLSHNNELEQKLKLLQDLYDESEARATTAIKLNLEYQQMRQVSDSAKEEAESKLQMTESEFILLRKKNLELEEKLNFTATDKDDTDKVLKEFQEKIFELSEMLGKFEDESKSLTTEMIGHKDRISYLESALEESSMRRCELEAELKVVTERCVEHEDRATTAHQRSLELEDMILVSHSKAEDAGTKARDLELLVKSSEHKKREIEEYLRSVEAKYMETEAESKHYSSKFSEISAELEVTSEKLLGLELSLQDAKEKETELMETVRETTEERKSFADKISHLESALEQSYVKNKELDDKLKVALEKCVEHEGHASSTHQRSLELEDLMNISHSKAENAESKVVELELFLKNSEEKRHELEAHLRSTETKFLDAKEECEQNSSKVFKLSEDLEASLEKVSSLECMLSDANGKERELKEQVALVMTERENFEDKIKQLECDLNQSSSRILELEQGLKVLTEKCAEHEGLSNVHHKRCLELEGLIETSQSKAEAAKIECETYATKTSKLLEDLEVSLEKISNLEVALNNAKNKEMELKENLELFIVDQGTCEGKIKQLENEVALLSSRNLELEQNLKVVSEKCVEHEGRADQINQRSLELEDLIQVSHSQAQNTERRVDELQLLVKNSEQKQHELEEQLAFSKLECKRYDTKLSELSLELEASLANASSLEAALSDANETEEGLKKSIHLLTEEKKAFEEASIDYSAKLSQVDNLLQFLQNELRMTQQKLVTVEGDLEVATLKETETMMKLKHSEEQMDQQRLIMEEYSAKYLELESFSKDADMKLQNEIENFVQKDSEAKELLEKLNALEKQAAVYQEQAMEASSDNEALQAQLEEHLEKLTSLEKFCDELKNKVTDSENKINASSSENEILVEINLKLKEQLEDYHNKISELENLLQALHIEKEATIEELKLHKNNIDELTDKHARALELYSVSDAHAVVIEQKLHEAVERYTLRDTDAKELNENVQVLETQLRTHKENAADAVNVIETQKAELEQMLSKLVHLEGAVEELQSHSSRVQTENEALAEANLKLAHQVAAYQTEISELQVTLNTVQSEKVEIVQQFNACKMTFDDLTEQHKTEAQKLQSQISSIVTESHSLNETYENSRKEFVALRSELEDKIKEGKAREDSLSVDIENLRSEVAEKLTMLSRIGELEQNLALSEAQLKELKEMESRKDSDRESTLKNAVAELEAKNLHASILEKHIEQSASMLKMKEEKISLINAELENSKIKINQTDELEKKIEDLENELKLARLKPDMQARDITDLAAEASSPSKRKSKKKPEAVATQTARGSPVMGFKVIVSVALVSLLMGLLLGGRN